MLRLVFSSPSRDWTLEAGCWAERQQRKAGDCAIESAQAVLMALLPFVRAVSAGEGFAGALFDGEEDVHGEVGDRFAEAAGPPDFE
jgi:hypothetical protein